MYRRTHWPWHWSLLRLLWRAHKAARVGEDVGHRLSVAGPAPKFNG